MATASCRAGKQRYGEGKQKLTSSTPVIAGRLLPSFSASCVHLRAVQSEFR
jgi:hypothetical protein